MKQVLITGGDGYLGQGIARHYLERGKHKVLLWVRGGDAHTIKVKRERLRLLYGRDFKCLTLYWGDLADVDPFNGIEAANIEHIVHAAAVIAFNVDKEIAATINVEGTRKLCEFAGTCKDLRSLAFISSLYASGLDAGPLKESRFIAGQGHANHYEWSKWQAEQLPFDEYRHLPWKILRVGTIVADDAEGHVTQVNAIHNTLKLFYYGLLPIIPGHQDTPLYLATGDYVASAIYAAMHLDSSHQVLHLTHDRRNAVTLGEFVDLAYAQFAQDRRFASRRILKPLYSDYESFDLLARGVIDFGGSMVSRAFSTVSPFAAQLFIEKTFDAREQNNLLPGQKMPGIHDVVKKTCQHLVQTNFKVAKAQ